MLGKEALCRNRRRDLRQFIDRFCPDLDKTRRKFFRQSLWGMLQSASLTVSKWLRWIPDGCTRWFYRHKRLLNQFKSKDWNHTAVLRSYQQQWADRIEYDTPLIIDLTDLPRPRGRKLPYIRLVRDGSEDRLHYGYWCVEIYAYWSKGRITPLCLHPYSTEAPGVLSENAQILAAVDQVLQATKGRGVLVMDRAADRRNLLIPWIDQHRRFVIRMKGDRQLLLDNGSLVPAGVIAEQLLANAVDRQHGWCRVYLPERPDHPLYLVCKVLPGSDRPLILLTSLTAQNLSTAKNVLSYYRKRWKCEEAARFLKTGLGMEKIRLRIYDSLPRLLLLAMLAMGFLTWLELHFASLAQSLSAAAPGRRKVKFLYYRLLNWLQEQFHHSYCEAKPP